MTGGPTRGDLQKTTNLYLQLLHISLRYIITITSQCIMLIAKKRHARRACLPLESVHVSIAVYNIRKIYWATFSFFGKKRAISNMPWYSWYVIFVYVIMIKRGVSTERFENIRYYIRKLNIKLIYMLIFNTFQKHSADSKLSTNTYLMSVATVFRKL